MTTPITSSTTDSQIHNKIMATGLKDQPPMLATGRYAQWRSPVDATDNSLAIPQHTTVETVLNMSKEDKAHFQAKKEAIFLLLTGIGDETYSTVDACKTANEMWIAIERLQQDSNEDNDPEQAQKDKVMQKKLALIAKYFKKLYKPTNNLRTSSNSRNKTVDISLRYKNDNQSGHFRNQRTMTVARPRETVADDNNVILDSSNMCNNDNQVDHNDVEFLDERAMLANLIANLTLDTEQNKKILKQLKKANASLTHELKE
ncbi:hypothetical protein Tco_0756695 [Tanacetum coccineum]